LQNLSIEKRNSGQYLLSQLIARLKAGQIQILPEKFKEPGIPRERVDDTQTKNVIAGLFMMMKIKRSKETMNKSQIHQITKKAAHF